MSGISLVNIRNNEYYEKESLNSDGQQFHTLIKNKIKIKVQFFLKNLKISKIS
jgi:hypothetical protein